MEEHPVTDQNTPPRSFRLGLAMAGAATGGAFSAGVLDFLWQALSEWEAAKKRADPDVPTWSVSISDVTGASAGGLTAFVAASTANAEYIPNALGTPLPNVPVTASPLFNAWVSLITAERLFDKTDLENQPADNRQVASILSSNFMLDTAKTVVPEPSSKPRPDWIEPNMMLTLTATNLRGVPYSLNGFASSDPLCSNFAMRRHADYIRFHFNLPGDDDVAYAPPDSIPVDLQAQRSTDTWQKVINAARATAAFPIGFPSVRIDVPRQYYYARPGANPSWSDDQKTGMESYAALDGGILNNEPFTLLENQMRQRHGRKLQADPTDAWGSILLIDPFPDRLVEDDRFTDGNTPLMQVIGSLLPTIRGDAMFKEEDILHALDENRLDRFMIVPNRTAESWQPNFLATGGLGAFAGILHEKLRRHDYLLGRKNCQEFLTNVLRLHVEAARENELFNEHEAFLTGESVAIIPLVGKAAEPLQEPEWPVFTEREAWNIVCEVASQMEPRLSLIVDILLENSGLIKAWSWNPLWMGTNAMVKMLKVPVMRIVMVKLRRKLYAEMKPFIPPKKQSV